MNTLTFNASCRPSRTALLKGSVSFFRSVLALFLADIRSSRMRGRRPLRLSALTNNSKDEIITHSEVKITAYPGLASRHNQHLVQALTGQWYVDPEESCSKDYEPS